MFDDTEHNPFERATGKGTVLTAVVHTPSFEEAVLADDPIVKRLFRLAHGRYRVIWTPTQNEKVYPGSTATLQKPMPTRASGS